MFEPNDRQNIYELLQSPTQEESDPMQVVQSLPRSEKPHKWFPWKGALIIATCACVSFFSAFAGNTMGGQDANSDAQGQASEVLYQSVVRTVSSTQSDDLSVADIAAITAVSVVEIRTETVQTGNRFGQYVSEGAGSGVIITTDGYIVTNNHVIDGATKITVRLPDGTSHDAVLVGKDAQTDLAVLKIEVTGLTPAVLGTSGDLRVGDLAVAIGNPLGELGGTVTDGIISALEREITIDGENMTLLQTNAAINPGNSGGGLFNASGELVGIVNAKSSGTDVEGLGFAIPIDTAKVIVEQLIDNGYVTGRPSIGVTLVDLADTTTAMRYGANQRGVYVYEATNSALQSGDRIVSMNGQNISTLAEVKAIVSSSSIGDTLSVVVVRGNAQQTVNVAVIEQQ